MPPLIQAFRHIEPREILDIGLVTVLLYETIIWIRRAKAGLTLVGICILGAVYILAYELDLRLTMRLFQGFFAILVIVLVVIFQKELRQIFERIAVRSLRSKRLLAPSDKGVDSVLEAVSELARRRRGALIVIPGSDPLERHTEGGIALDGKLSYPLLVSLFDPNSDGHDGAAILAGERVSKFAVQLPLSNDFAQLGRRGTRHSAALGLAECTDAACIVVSEESGGIALARDGKLRRIASVEDLQAALGSFRGVKSRPRTMLQVSIDMLRRNWLERGLAVSAAAGLWLVFISGEQVSRQVFEVPVVVDHVPADFTLQDYDPRQVMVTLSGLRRDFYLLDRAELQVEVDGFPVRLGRRTFQISEDNVRHPPKLEVVDVEPRKVTLSAEQGTGAEQQGDERSPPFGGRRPS